MMAGIRMLENITRVTPMGLRFWDNLTGQVISDGLQVTAYPKVNPERRISAISNRAGVFVLRGLPGLYPSETGNGIEEFWADLPVKRPFIIQVIDMERRFLPFEFDAELPVRGFFNLECVSVVSPPDIAGFVPLFSAPSRAVPGAMAVLRAQLWDSTRDVPASWALLVAQGSGLSSKKGLADEKGRVAIIFPYPEPTPSPNGSLPNIGKSLFDQSWELQLQLFYDPKKKVPEIPDFYQFFQQDSATLLKSLSPVTPLPSVLLEYGKELVVKSDSQSILYVMSPGSPP